MIIENSGLGDSIKRPRIITRGSPEWIFQNGDSEKWRNLFERKCCAYKVTKKAKNYQKLRHSAFVQLACVILANMELVNWLRKFSIENIRYKRARIGIN